MCTNIHIYMAYIYIWHMTTRLSYLVFYPIKKRCGPHIFRKFTKTESPLNEMTCIYELQKKIIYWPVVIIEHRPKECPILFRVNPSKLQYICIKFECPQNGCHLKESPCTFTRNWKRVQTPNRKTKDGLSLIFGLLGKHKKVPFL